MPNVFFLILIGKYDKAVLIKNLAVKQENYFVLKKHHAKFPRSWVKKNLPGLDFEGKNSSASEIHSGKAFLFIYFCVLNAWTLNMCEMCFQVLKCKYLENGK